MSLLDGMFDSGPDLIVSPVQISADATIDPGYVYLVLHTGDTRRLTIAALSHELTAGQRLAVKVISYSESQPGTLTVVAPSGQTIDDGFGSLGTEVEIPGGQTPGTYAEWLCDAYGQWWLVSSGGGGGGGGAIVVQEEGVDVGDTPRAKLNFKGYSVWAEDNPDADCVDVTIDLGEGAFGALVVQEEGSNVGQQRTLNFIGGSVTAVDNPAEERIDVTIAGGGGVAVQEEGAAIATRPAINFIGGSVTAVDNPGAGRVDVTIVAAPAAVVSVVKPFTWVAEAATIDVSTANAFVPTNTATGNCVLTLTGGVDGCSGLVYFKQNASSAYGLTFVTPSRTQLRDLNVPDTTPLGVGNGITMYQYCYVTIAGTTYIVINKVFLQP